MKVAYDSMTNNVISLSERVINTHFFTIKYAMY